MTLPELHPDELLSREASSTLTPREWADLSAHLERCPACALERAVSREAARARVPSSGDHAIAARVVGRLLAGQAQAETYSRQSHPGGPLTRVGVWGRRVAYGVLALVLVSGTAAAGVALVTQIRRHVPDESTDRPRPSARPLARQHRTANARSEEIEQGRAEPTTAPSEPAPQRELTPPGPSSIARAEAKAARSPAVTRHRSLSTSPTPPPSRPDPDRASADAAALLGDAETAESSGQLREASRLYGELGRRFPGTREEIVARALHGQLLLDRLVNPGRALALFDGYLNAEPAGTLAEEARLGRARAFEKLGRSGEERGAWLDLLRAHPRSVHASAARTRLAALDRP